MFSCFLRSRRTQNKDKAPACDGDGSTKDNIYVDPPQLTLRSLMAETDNFAARNKLGVREGELGPVFKGKHEVIAVRRLPRRYWMSFQFHELKHELAIAAKLKHANIVRLLGVCLEQREKLLVYEYVPHPSLDTILFDTEQRRRHLNSWVKRHFIIKAIARGLLYLHEESGLPITHKGILRPSKVLLDDDMTHAKILGAGIPHPRPIKEDQSAFICRYAAPEWRVTGETSTKTDMFSFGVILLEMVTGRGMYYDWCSGKKSKNGISYIWDKWKSRSIEDIADELLGYRYDRNEMRNCVHIGLLCLQEDQELRPNARTVMLELNNSYPALLPTPSKPYLA
ncbi:hypothetical protein ACQ4PT_026653 [Festuca glaucescens]